MMRVDHRSSLLLFALLQVCYATTTAHASSLLQTQLRGISAVQVTAYVTPWENTRAADALAARLRRVAEERLRNAAMTGPPVALLSIQVDADRLKACPSLLALSISMELREKVLISRGAPDRSGYDATTWSRRVLLIVESDNAAEQIEKVVNNVAEVFIADVHEANRL
jgi:hypothetical protein